MLNHADEHGKQFGKIPYYAPFFFSTMICIVFRAILEPFTIYLTASYFYYGEAMVNSCISISVLKIVHNVFFNNDEMHDCKQQVLRRLLLNVFVFFETPKTIPSHFKRGCHRIR